MAMKLPRVNPWHVLAALSAATFIACAGGGTSNPGPPPPPATSAPGRATLAAFNQLRQGMSYEEATALMGSPGKLSSSAGSMQTYTFEGEALASAAALTFTEARLSAYSQFGLR